MRVWSKVVWDIGTLEILECVGYEYTGPLELCGGGKSAMRNLTQQQATTQAANSAADRATQQTAQGKVQGVADQLTSTGPGKMSPWSSANYASNLDNIAKTYGDQRSMGFRALGQSGFGTSPGATASIFNTAGENMGRAQTDAYRGGLQDTLNQTLEGTRMNQNTSGQYGGQSMNESNMAVGDAAQRSKMGSTFGDIMGGIGAIAPIAAAPFTGGASLAGLGGGFGGGGQPFGGGFGGVKRPGSGNYANTNIGNF